MEQVELAAHGPVGAVRPRRAHLVEELGVGERVRERQLGRDPPLLVLLRRVDVGVPPGERGGVEEGLETVDGPLHDVARRAHGASGYP